jgi:hypothetical protein
LEDRPGAAVVVGKRPNDLVVDFFTIGGALDRKVAVDRLEASAKALGVDLDVVSYARFDGRVNYLIGAKPHEQGKPTIWLDKDTLLVARVVMVQKGEGGALQRTDVRYLGWGSPIGGVWFPSSIEVWVDDKLVRRTSVSQVDRNMSFDATLFQLK